MTDTAKALHEALSDTSVDLRPFLRSMGGHLSRAPLDVPEREDPETPAELLDDQPVKVEAEPFGRAVFVDGIQSASVITYVSHRPVALVMAAAGGVDQDLDPVRVEETIEVLCAKEDVQFVLDADCPVSVRSVSDEVNPSVVERTVAHELGESRDELEILMAAELLQEDPDCVVVVDGQLASRPASDRLFGVVKTTNSRLLTDESPLWRLPEGWRSPRFKMPPNYGGPSQQRFSCYVRLRNASGMPWQFGLIRVESFDPELLDRVAATALAYRQPTGNKDARGDRHLAPVAHVERWLRSRRPSYL